VSNGFVGIQSEGADFEIRRMTLIPLPSASSLPPTELHRLRITIGSPTAPHNYPAILEPWFRNNQ